MEQITKIEKRFLLEEEIEQLLLIKNYKKVNEENETRTY
jgi:hypothetical protein